MCPCVGVGGVVDERGDGGVGGGARRAAAAARGDGRARAAVGRRRGATRG